MVKTITSNERKLAQLKSNKCMICGENRIPALTSMEAHHLIGNKEGFTITICQNCHKVFEHKKEFWNDDILKKERTQYSKTLAYIYSFCDFSSMHGEQLLNYYNFALENDLDADVDLIQCKIKASKIIYVIGSLMIFIPKIIISGINKVSIDKQTEDKFNKLLNSFEPKLKIIIEKLQKRGIRYDK